MSGSATKPMSSPTTSGAEAGRSRWREGFRRRGEVGIRGNGAAETPSPNPISGSAQRPELGLIGKTQRTDEIPRFESPGMNGPARIVSLEAGPQVVGLADVVLSPVVDAFDQVHVVRGGRPHWEQCPLPPSLWRAAFAFVLREEKPAGRRCQSAFGWPASRRLGEGWCSGRESNPHAFRHTPLKRVCLPVPPPERSRALGGG